MHKPTRSVWRRARFPQYLLGALFLLVVMSYPSFAADDSAYPALTDAQQAAKQLAATLESSNRRGTAAPSRAPLVNLADPSVHLGQRLVRVLYASERIEVRAVRGRSTLVSPVDDVAAVSADARRPILRQADDGAMAVEVLVD